LDNKIFVAKKKNQEIHCFLIIGLLHQMRAKQRLLSY